MSAEKRRGERTVFFANPPRIISAASIVGDVEGKGPLGSLFDKVLSDDTWGEKSWERAECKMFEYAVRRALKKTGWNEAMLHCMLGGDLLNQNITANYAARELRVPFFGLYSACSTLTESILLGSILIDGGFASNSVCVASSHFSTAERQFRAPLEMGGITTPTAQRTVTGAGAVLLTAQDVALMQAPPIQSIRVKGGTIGCVVDMGISDVTNMGAAMAPAACDTIVAHLRDSELDITHYDAIITGDLGRFGSEMLLELCIDEGLDIEDRHIDCGNLIFAPEQNVDCGGSGCGCAAVVLTSHLLPMLQNGPWHRILFLATGALMSPASSQQGETIPCISHAISLERSE